MSREPELLAENAAYVSLAGSFSFCILVGRSLLLASVAWFAQARLGKFALPLALLLFFFVWYVIST